jgi:sulfite reductase (NADPH) hemoprotein beta-component
MGISPNVSNLLTCHRVLKSNLRTAIREINFALLTTIGACGDVNRNVMCSSMPTLSKLHAEVYEASKAISNRLLPSTSAYHEVSTI